MPQELSVSYQAVKTKVHRLMDAVVEGAKSEGDIGECIRAGGLWFSPRTVRLRRNTCKQFWSVRTPRCKRSPPPCLIWKAMKAGM